MLCVLLAHAYAIVALMVFMRPLQRLPNVGALTNEPIDIPLEPDKGLPSQPDVPPSAMPPATPQRVPSPSVSPKPAPAPAAGESSAPDFVDWPVEQRISARRALEAEREAERVAKMFSGPDGTWASLTKRERSRLQKFRWKPGVDGFEYDEKGNAIFHISEGCVVVNLAFIGCALGKAKVHGDLFKDMRLYFDEQRLPPMDDGNGTEPEALRPAN